MKALRKLSIQDKTYYLLEWGENHPYQKTPYYLRNGNWKFASSLYESRKDSDLLLFEMTPLFGSLRLSTGEVEVFDKARYWSLAKLPKKTKIGALASA
jgi:hypothetical protein